MKKGKKYAEVAKLVNSTQKYTVVEGLSLACQTSTTKFDASVDAVFRLNIDPRKAEQNLRGAIVLPHGTGKTRTVLVIASGAKAEEAKAAGADFVGEADYIEQIQKGWFGFDVMIATPDKMAMLGRLGRLLGPKGLMPNPKTGTVTMNVAQAVKNAKAGQVQFRADKAGIIHASIGRASFDAARLQTNLNALVDALVKAKPAAAKGQYIRKAAVSSTMGVGVRVEVGSLTA